MFHTGEVCGQWSPMEGPHAGPGEGLLSLRKKAATETITDELEVISTPCLHASLEEGGRELEIKLSLGRNEG